MHFKPDMTVAEILDLNPMAAQVLFRHGVRSFFSPCVKNETIEHLSEQFHFTITNVLEELDRLYDETADVCVDPPVPYSS